VVVAQQTVAPPTVVVRLAVLPTQGLLPLLPTRAVVVVVATGTMTHRQAALAVLESLFFAG